MAETPIIPPPLETPGRSSFRIPIDMLLAPDHGWFRALRHSEFRFFWSGNFVSNIGSWMQNVAQGWLILQLTDSPFWLALVGFAQQIPALFFSLFAGVIADRVPRRKMLLFTQSAMMILALLLAVPAQLHVISVRQIVVIAFLAGIIMSLNAPTYQAAIRDLVPREDTLNAIALNSIQFNSSRVLGPSFAGFAIAGLGIAACFYLNALSYLPLLFVIGRVSFPPHPIREEHSWRGEMVEGFRYVQGHREILVLIVLVGMVSMFGLPYLVMMPAFARDVLHVGAAGLGYLVAAAGAGALLGGVHLARLKPHHHRGPLVLSATMIFFAAILLFCLSRSPLLSTALLAIAGGAMVTSVATINSLIQTIVPASLLGRVVSIYMMAYLGLTPLGSLLVGGLAEFVGTPVAMAMTSGFAFVLTLVINLTVPSIHRLH
ncbi:MAG TPA: MFS transporter [Candidatus Dormibacteraeota bacterium]|nr:MFS transporter [Candidatus Dormibacteraeota bacterium]